MRCIADLWTFIAVLGTVMGVTTIAMCLLVGSGLLLGLAAAQSISDKARKTAPKVLHKAAMRLADIHVALG
jgi:hypothetical protein